MRAKFKTPKNPWAKNYNPPKLRRIQSEGDFFFVGRGVEILKFPVTSNLIVQ